MQFIELTTYDGMKLEINPDQICDMISLPKDDGRTTITMSNGEKLTVNQTTAIIKNLCGISQIYQ